jgi:hypothetical protein
MARALTYVTRPLSDRSWLTPADERVPSRFGPTRYAAKDREKAENRWWADTREMLARELDLIDATDVVLGVDVRENQIRVDGMLYANASPASPAVELAFNSKQGPLLYRLDRFTGSAPAYRHNIRAIALTLEYLRGVDRYGATSTGQQYAGWRQIEAAHTTIAAPDQLAVARAYVWKIAYAATHGREDPPPMFTPDADDLRRAKFRAHPDSGGTREQWDTLHGAAMTLGLDW